MNKTKLLFLPLLLSFFCCVISNAKADSRPVMFTHHTKTDNNNIQICPFSDVLPPDGYLCDATLFINLNTASLYTNIRIEKEDEGTVSSKWLSHDEDKVVDYDLSMYGSGEYTVTIAFSNGETYEAIFVIE